MRIACRYRYVFTCIYYPSIVLLITSHARSIVSPMWNTRKRGVAHITHAHAHTHTRTHPHTHTSTHPPTHARMHARTHAHTHTHSHTHMWAYMQILHAKLCIRKTIREASRATDSKEPHVLGACMLQAMLFSPQKTTCHSAKSPPETRRRTGFLSSARTPPPARGTYFHGRVIDKYVYIYIYM